MTINPISNLSIQSSLVSTLQTEQSSLTNLATQLSTSVKHTNLTDYSASDARNLINLQSTATQKQAYISVIGTVGTNLSVYDTTLTDLESIAAQAQTIANNNPTYNVDSAANVAISSGNYLRSVGADLNQEINGRYIYAGTRYTTPPVQDLSNLPTASLSPTIQTNGSTVPSYDSASSLVESTAGQNVTISGTPAVGQTASITVNGTAYNYTVTGTDTPTTIAANLATLVTAGGVATTSIGGVLTVAGGGTITNAVATATSTAAYTTDQATIDTGYTINYGVSSNDPAIQQLVAGLRFLQAAGKSTDSATYQSNIQQAQSLLTSAISSLQTLHTGVANNINVVKNEETVQKTAISNLTDQVDNIQQVDVTQVSAEITALQAILQASYVVTGDIEKLSIVHFL